MRLEPCVSCLRHVNVAGDSCPFCGAPTVSPPLRVFVAGRFSRAAVIAGAALTGCYTSTNRPPQNPTPLHPEDSRTQDPRTQDPPDDRFAKPPVGSGTIRGTIVDAASKNPIQGVQVYAYPNVGGNPLQTTTDADGNYELRDVPAGRYSLSFSAPGRANASRYEQPMAPGKAVTVADGTVERADSAVTYTIHSPPPPYGAPPPRRRVV